MRLIVIGIVIVMKAAFDRPDSHVLCTDGTRIWLECTLYYSYTLHMLELHTVHTVQYIHYTHYTRSRQFSIWTRKSTQPPRSATASP